MSICMHICVCIIVIIIIIQCTLNDGMLLPAPEIQQFSVHFLLPSLTCPSQSAKVRSSMCHSDSDCVMGEMDMLGNGE